MTESINLDSTDLVEDLEFGTLDASLEEELDMLSQEEHMGVNEIDVSSEIIMKDEMDEEEIKEEVVEHMEDVDNLLDQSISYESSNVDPHDDMHTVMDVVEDHTTFTEDDNGNLTQATPSDGSSQVMSDHEMFSTDDVICEEVVSEEKLPEEDDEEEETNPVETASNNVTDAIRVEEVRPTVVEVKTTKQNSSDLFVINPSPVTAQATVLSTPSTSKDAKRSVVGLPPQTGGSSTSSGSAPGVSGAAGGGGPPLVQSPHPQQQTLRIVTQSGKFLQGTPKTITLAQAKQMGLFNFTTLSSTSRGGMSKIVMPKNTVTVMKSPTKILPAPSGTVGTLGRGQKVVIRTTGTSGQKTGTILASGSSLIKMSASQAAQLHLTSPNKQLQFVKVVGTTGGTGSVSGTGTGGTKASSSTTTLLPVQSLAKSLPLSQVTSLLGGGSSQQTFKVLPVSQSSLLTTSQTVSGTTQRILIPASATHQVSVQQTPQRQSILMLQPQIISPIQEETVYEETTKTSTNNETISAEKSGTTPSASKNGRRSSTPSLKTKEDGKGSGGGGEPKSEPETDMIEANGIRPRKPCNCTKSMCLKLYCDCFANGEFCYQCNCTTCFNNLQHEEERQRAIKSCLERNPTAFRPKIGKTYVGSDERRHNKGCNCRRSGCLKNYCECYEAKIPCSKNCKCIGCKNTDAFITRGLGFGGGTGLDDERLTGGRERAERGGGPTSHYEGHLLSGHRQVLNYMTPTLMEATCQCLMAQVEEWSRTGSTDLELAQALVIEELGRCLAQLIECIHKSIGQFPQLS